MGRKKQIGVRAAALFAALFLFLIVSLPSWAYFDLGDVTVSLGESSISLETGSSKTVSVKVSPASSDQTQGCGMAECPQSCGEKNCLDSNGQCCCMGKSYSTYYTDVLVSSSNTSVATASYSSGTLNVKAIGTGSAKITVTGSLRQFTDGSATLSVTVKDKAAATTAAKSSSSSSAGSASKSTSGSTKVKKKSTNKAEKEDGRAADDTELTAEADTAAEEASTEETDAKKSKKKKKKKKKKAEEETTEAARWETVESDKGTIYYEEIVDGLQGHDLLETIAGTDAYAVFRKTDDAENVAYSWEYFGQDVTDTTELDMDILITEEVPEAIADTVGSTDVLYLDFLHEGNFPGKAMIYVQVGEPFENEDTLYVYDYDEEKEELTLLDDTLTVTDGYVNREMDTGANLLLSKKLLSVTEEAEESQGGVMVWPIVLVIVIAAAVVLVVVIYVRRRRA